MIHVSERLNLESQHVRRHTFWDWSKVVMLKLLGHAGEGLGPRGVDVDVDVDVSNAGGGMLYIHTHV